MGKKASGNSKQYSMNLLAAPKNKDFMRCFIPKPGYVLIQADIVALEPHILAHASQDINLMRVYGPNAKPGHDIYLLAGLGIAGIGDKIRPYYDINIPDPNLVNQAKKDLKQLRNEVLKKTYLGWQYGVGAETLATNMRISFAEAETILKGLKRQFAGKQRLQVKLTKEWAKNKGYIINGRGRPICIDFGSKQDIINRYVQSTGVDFLNRILLHMNNFRLENSIDVIPYLSNFHDESVWQVKDDPTEIEKATKMFEYGMNKLNEEINWSVVFRWGGISTGKDLSIRCE